MSWIGKEQEQIPQELLQEHKGNNGNKGNNGGNGNGNGRISEKQLRYLEDLCKELNVIPAIDLSSISRDKATQYITDLEKIRPVKTNRN